MLCNIAHSSGSFAPRKFQEILAVQKDASRIRLQNAADAVQERTLARPIVAQNGRDGSGRNIKVNIRPKLPFAISKTQMSDLQQGIRVAAHLTHPSALKIM